MRVPVSEHDERAAFRFLVAVAFEFHDHFLQQGDGFVDVAFFALQDRVLAADLEQGMLELHRLVERDGLFQMVDRFRMLSEAAVGIAEAAVDIGQFVHLAGIAVACHEILIEGDRFSDGAAFKVRLRNAGEQFHFQCGIAAVKKTQLL